MREIKAIIRPERLPDVVRALHEIPHLPGLTTSIVRGLGRRYPTYEQTFDEVEMVKLEIVVPDAVQASVIAAIEHAARTGRVGDGRIFASPIDQVVTIHSGEREADTHPA